MWNNGFNQLASAVNYELATDRWIQRNIPGGLNSPLGKKLDMMMGGNPNPTFGQVYGGFPGYGGGYGYSYLGF